MAERVFNIAPTTIGLNTPPSPDRLINIQITNIDATLVDGGNWATAVGDLTWGFEVSLDNGASFKRDVWQTIPCGTMNGRDPTKMPALGTTRDAYAAFNNVRVRLFATCTAFGGVSLGAVIVAKT